MASQVNTRLANHLDIAIMYIRVHHGIIAKKYPKNGLEVEFTPLVANDYFAQVLESGFIEITKSNGELAFINADRFAQLIESQALVVIQS
jgi:hypothetical protein